MRSSCWAFLAAALTEAVSANTEKVIFVAPGHISIPDARPGLDVLGLDVISPQAPTLRTSLAVSFPTPDQPYGRDHWFLLEGLKSHQRHELRVCWAATVRCVQHVTRGFDSNPLTSIQQPTAYQLDTYNISYAFESPDLIQSLAQYSESRQAARPRTVRETHSRSDKSIALLRVRAAADFFTSNENLMQQPQEVLVDLILDQYLGGIFPDSLQLTAAYIVALACAAFYVSDKVWHFVRPTEPKRRID